MLEFVVSSMAVHTGAGRSRHNDSERIRFELNRHDAAPSAATTRLSHRAKAGWPCGRPSTCATGLLHYIRSASIEILGMTTRGDQILDRTLSKVGGKGLFVKELEVAMAEGRADLAVHSLKDVPMELPEGFELAAVLEREDPRDAFVSNDYDSLAALPAGAVVGTSSLRRQALIAARYPQLVIKPLRGNLDTRLGKLDRGDYAAIILAAAGLKRLGLPQRIRACLEPETACRPPGRARWRSRSCPARADGVDLRALLAPLNHAAHRAGRARPSARCRKVFGGSCQIPLAAHATVDGDTLHLRAMVATPDGTRMRLRRSAAARPTLPEALGEQVAPNCCARRTPTAILAECKPRRRRPSDA